MRMSPKCVRLMIRSTPHDSDRPTAMRACRPPSSKPVSAACRNFMNDRLSCSESARRGEERRARLYRGRWLEGSPPRSARRGEERRARLYRGRWLEDSPPQPGGGLMGAAARSAGQTLTHFPSWICVSPAVVGGQKLCLAGSNVRWPLNVVSAPSLCSAAQIAL